MLSRPLIALARCALLRYDAKVFLPGFWCGMSVSKVVPESAATEPSAPRRTFRRRLLLAISLMVAGVLFVISPFSAKLLQVAHQDSAFDFVMIGDLHCGQCYREAANLSKSAAAEGILLYAEPAKRLELLGAILPIDELGRRKLIADGVDERAIQVIDGTAQSDWQAGRLLDDWLRTHPDKRVIVLTNAFGSGRWSIILDRTVASSLRPRVFVEAVQDPRYNSTNWWSSRTGLKTFFNGLFRLAYATCAGEDQTVPIDWSAEKYESAALKQRS